MLGIAAERKLATACEQRLGQIVHVASLFELSQICSPAGSLKPRTPLSAAIALTDTDIWLLNSASGPSASRSAASSDTALARVLSRIGVTGGGLYLSWLATKASLISWRSGCSIAGANPYDIPSSASFIGP